MYWIFNGAMLYEWLYIACLRSIAGVRAEWGRDSSADRRCWQRFVSRFLRSDAALGGVSVIILNSTIYF